MVGSAYLASEASSDATDAQVAQSNRAMDLQREQYNTARTDSAPYRQTGVDALNRIRAVYGMAPIAQPDGSVGADASGGIMPNGMPQAFSLSGRGGMGPGTAQPGGAVPPRATIGGAFRAAFGKPEIGAPDPNAPRMVDGGAMPGRPVTAAQGMLEMDPGYAFRLEQGQQALERGAAARGGALGGGALRDLAQFSQGLASQEYGAAYGRARQENLDAYGRYSDQYNRMASLAGLGQTQVAGDNNLGAQYAGAQSNLLTGIGNAQAAGSVGSANAMQTALGQGMNYYQGNRMIDAMGAGRGSSYGGGGGGTRYGGDINTGLGSRASMVDTPF
jgi:hypothetical protein